MTATLVPDTATRPSDGGRPARRAVLRWAWRLFARQWRQQLLVVALLTVAVAATTVGLGVVINVSQSVEAEYGTANTSITVNNPGSETANDTAKANRTFGTVEAIEHRKIAVAGSVNAIDLRAQDPHGAFAASTLRLRSGHWPSGPDDVAVTAGVAQSLDLTADGTWNVDGRTLQVVGIVENPLNLQDDFALVAPGQIQDPASLQLLVHTSTSTLQGFRLNGDLAISRTDQDAATQKRIQSIAVLLMGTIGMLFVGLLAVAGFTVLVQRRQRSLGMLAAVGATDRHVKLVMIANGLIVGGVGAAVGLSVGLSGWILLAPTFEHIAQHRIDRFDLPWWAVGSAAVLSVLTAAAASWWPARAAARMSVVSALSGRPAPPRPAHRFAAAGLVLAVIGYSLLVFARQRNAPMIIGGVVATTFGMLLLAPVGLRLLASIASHVPVPARLALRDLARYQARSGAALAAVSLAIGIAATIALSAAANAATHTMQHGNLAANQLLIHTQPDFGPVTELTDEQLKTVRALGQTIATSVGATGAVELDYAEGKAPIMQGAIVVGGSPTDTPRHPVAMLGKVTRRAHGTEISGGLEPYVATPTLLAALGIPTSSIDSHADLLSSRTDLGGMELLGRDRDSVTPNVQHLSKLPIHTSAPSTLITQTAMDKLGFVPTPAAWLIIAPHVVTKAQIDDAIHKAAAAGVSIETRKDPVRSLARLRDLSTAIGVLVALGVLAMTVGLIRAETAHDVRTLTATGASAMTRRAFTASTAAALGVLGGLIGTGAAYLALLAWNHKHPGVLTHVPVLNLAAIIVGLPLMAAAGGWLLAGREPTAIARRPLD